MSFIALAVTAVVGIYISRPQTVASASNAPISTARSVTTKPVEQVEVPPTGTPQVLSETQNDITVNITSAQVIDTGLEVGICYTAIDNGEWRPMPGHLFYAKYEVFPDEIQFLESEILADGKNTGTRCALIRYRIDDLNTITTPIKFSILQFYAPGREMYSPCEELQQRLKTNPQAQAYGLNVSCEENADGSTKVALVGNNEAVTIEKAQKTLDIIASAEISGNWEFTITDIKR